LILDKEKFLRSNKLLYWLYKIQKIYKNKKPNIHYGEFGEDIMVNRFFKNKEIGLYIDIGAYHPFKGSLTQKLYKKGWHGVNIDISKTSIDLFKIARPKDININCAIGKVTEETIFFENSKINQQNSLIRQNLNQKEVEIKCYELNDILIFNKIEKVDYINIDTEGTELDVLKGLNFQKIKPSLLTIEDNDFDLDSDSKKEKIAYMKNQGYVLINNIGVTMFFFKKEDIKRISNLIKI
tara:strand:+ start:102 stop:815 length:714 start_codon:yes stop_codon:yes gene_type:complete